MISTKLFQFICGILFRISCRITYVLAYICCVLEDYLGEDYYPDLPGPEEDDD